ncbi:transposase [Xinfangfangia sp. D13-10-4-6]|uniref:transposase n=1 Tax=Pseudogemmobacter hezensis TaxID=2737662 RepID=UPI0015556050|nr:transposase [Pseudogemmobacter hezensis]NPD17634.1 transposase [Pseudogemmobacter hezensis]
MSRATKRFSPEFRLRVVLMVPDNEGQHGACWQSVMSIAAKIGGAPQTLSDWARKAEVDSGKWPGLFSEMSDRMKALSPYYDHLATRSCTVVGSGTPGRRIAVRDAARL